MHSNVEKNQRKIWIIGLILLLFAGMILSFLKVYTSQKASKYDLSNAIEVSDVESLQELLGMNEDVEIVLMADLTIPETVSVSGNKTLYGNKTLTADIDAREPYQLLDVIADASLTMAGPTIDGNGIATGIKVEKEGKLIYLEGKILWGMSYGIEAYGEVTIKDADISECDIAGVYVGYKGKVYAEGGEYYDCHNVLMLVEAGGYMELSEGTVFENSLSHGIRNRGELVVHGGTFRNMGLYAIQTSAELKMEYTGAKENGKIEFYNTTQGIIYNASTGTVSAKDIYGEDIGSTTFKTMGGTSVLENWEIKNVNSHAFYIYAGTAEISDVTIDTCGANGTYVTNPATLTLKNVSFKDVKKHGIFAYGGNIVGSNVTVENAGGQGVYNATDKNDVTGKLELTGFKASGVAKNNVYITSKTAAVTIKDGVLGVSGRTNINAGKGTITLNNVQVKGTLAEDCPAANVGKEGILNLYNTDITGGKVRGLTINGVANLYSGSIYGHTCAAESGGAVRVNKTGTFNMYGGKIYNNRTELAGGAIYVVDRAKLNMSGGSIYHNVAKNSGGAIQLGMYSTMNLSGNARIYENRTEKGSAGGILAYGTLTMSGGAIYQNESAASGGGISLNTKTDSKTKQNVSGVLCMSGGSIYENHAAARGGAIYLDKETTADLNGGKVSNNVCGTDGNGIYDNGNVEISDAFCMTGNQITLASAAKSIRIKNQSLSSHSKANPLLVEAYYYTKADTPVVKCDDAAAANLLLNYVASGNGSYTFAQQGTDIVVKYASADMNMAGADTVYVNNYKELKAAVESTVSKRYIVICFDVSMEGSIKVPGGATVYIKDDGKPRTIKRADGNNTNFFATSYGTGLYLVGTKEGYLTLNGECSSAVTKETSPQLVTVRGTTKIENVTFCENGRKTNTTMGAFLSQSYGQLEVANSTFSGANGGGGAAIYIAEGEAAITGSAFVGNHSSAGGGAIRVEGFLKVTDTTFTGNAATSVGGAINCDGGKLEAVGCTFESNTSKSTGAIYLTNRAEAEITGSTFKENVSVSYAGAMMVNKSTLTITNCEFAENSASKSSGAIRVYADSKVMIADSSFTGNIAKTEGGGAIRVEPSGTLEMTAVNFQENQAKKAAGGAIECEKGTLKITDCAFAKNSSAGTAGAINFIEGAKAEIAGTRFDSNKSSNNAAGALKVTDSNVSLVDSEFISNQAKSSGGAIKIETGSDVKAANTKFTKNSTLTSVGGAVNCEAGTFLAEGCVFAENESVTSKGGAIYITKQGAVSVLAGSSFDGNSAKTRGGAIDLNTGSLSVKDSEFCNNVVETAECGAAVNVAQGVQISIADAKFTGNGAEVTFSGSKTNTPPVVLAGLVTGVIFRYEHENKAHLAIGETGIADICDITIVPKSYKEGDLALCKAEGAGDTVLDNAATIIKVAAKLNGDEWTITSEGKLDSIPMAQIGNAAYKDLQEAFDAAADGDTIVLQRDVNMGSAMTLDNNKAVTITNRAGKDIRLTRSSNISFFVIKKGSTLNIQGSGNNTITLDGNKGNVTASKTMIENYGTFHLGTNGCLTDAKGTGAGPALRNYAGAKAALEGIVRGNETTNNGGAIYNNGGILTINGGIYSNNTATHGGLINNNASGQIIIQAGTFEENTATGNGGLINSSTAASITVKGGTYRKNNAEKNGGVINNVGTDETTTTIMGGTFTDNTAGKTAGAVLSKGTLTLKNCTINNNTSAYTSLTAPGCDISLGKNATLKVMGDAEIGVVHQTESSAKVEIGETLTKAITYIPYNDTYTIGATVVTFAEGVDKTVSAGKIVLRDYYEEGKTVKYDDTAYRVDKNGKLQKSDRQR